MYQMVTVHFLGQMQENVGKPDAGKPFLRLSTKAVDKAVCKALENPMNGLDRRMRGAALFLSAGEDRFVINRLCVQPVCQ
jgi:hypothetical protein